jgi:hypothetical protein
MPKAAPDESQERPVAVDVTLIDEMLRLTPKQRLEQNDNLTERIALRDAYDDRREVRTVSSDGSRDRGHPTS